MGSVSLNLLGGNTESITTQEDGYFIIRNNEVSLIILRLDV